VAQSTCRCGRAIGLQRLGCWPAAVDSVQPGLGFADGACSGTWSKARAALARHYRLDDGPRPLRLDDRTLWVQDAAHAVAGWQMADRVLRVAITPARGATVIVADLGVLQRDDLKRRSGRCRRTQAPSYWARIRPHRDAARGRTTAARLHVRSVDIFCPPQE
jgi:hypothetical protein